jgi:hypothetical protein
VFQTARWRASSPVDEEPCHGLHRTCRSGSYRVVSSRIGFPTRDNRVGVGHRAGTSGLTEYSKAAQRSGPLFWQPAMGLLLSLSRFMVHEASEARRPPRWLVDRALACSPARPRSWLLSV